MNRPNVEKLLNHLKWLLVKKKSYKFSMNHWLHFDNQNIYFTSDTIDDLRKQLQNNGISDPISPFECNTVACLAGHCLLLEDKKDIDARAFAIQYLDLDDIEANYMFYGDWQNEDYTSDITIQDAIQYLTRVLETNDVMVKID